MMFPFMAIRHTDIILIVFNMKMSPRLLTLRGMDAITE